MKHYLISTVEIGSAVLPPDQHKVEFHKQEDGTYKSGPVSMETAQECATISFFSAYKEGEKGKEATELTPDVDQSTTVVSPVAATGADGKPSDTNHPGGDPNGILQASVAHAEDQEKALAQADGEKEAKETGEEAEAARRRLLGLSPKPEAPVTLPDGKGGTRTLNEAKKPPDADKELKVSGVSSEATTPLPGSDNEQDGVEADKQQDQATLGVVNYANAGIQTDAERAQGKTPITPPSPTIASARPNNPLPGYTPDTVKSPDMSKQPAKSDQGAASAKADQVEVPGKADQVVVPGKAGDKAQASHAAKPSSGKASSS